MTDFATKDDLRTEIRSVKDEIKQVESSLRGEIKQVESSLRGEIGSLKEEVHFLGVRFEQLDTKVTAIAEGLVGFREHFTDEIRKLREELSGRIALLEEVIRGHSQDTKALQAEVADLRRRFDRYDQETELEKRVATIEKRLGIR